MSVTTKPTQPKRQSLAPRLIQVAAPGQPADDKSAKSAPRVRRVNSRTLLGDENSLVIDHEGVAYILRATRLGKLILTK